MGQNWKTVELRFRTTGDTAAEAADKAKKILHVVMKAEDDEVIDFGYSAWEPVEVREGYTHPADRADAIRWSHN